MAKPSKWVVTLSGDRAWDDLRDEVIAAGFAIGDVMGEIGVVAGEADDDAAEAVRKMRGVADVTPDRPVDIGPPGSPDTW